MTTDRNQPRYGPLAPEIFALATILSRQAAPTSSTKLDTPVVLSNETNTTRLGSTAIHLRGLTVN